MKGTSSGLAGTRWGSRKTFHGYFTCGNLVRLPYAGIALGANKNGDVVGSIQLDGTERAVAASAIRWSSRRSTTGLRASSPVRTAARGRSTMRE